MTARMNPDVKAKWLIALRSGEYKQARDDLRAVLSSGCVEHCCLGVLADLYRKEVGGYWLDREHGDVFVDATGGWAIGSYLTEDIRRWAGAPVDTIRDFSREPNRTLADLNDYAIWDFTPIADLIEEEL